MARIAQLPPEQRFGVVNAGISGNRLLLDGGAFGVNALARVDRDVLAKTGATTMIVLLGINDIQQDPHQTDPVPITTALRQLINQGQARGRVRRRVRLRRRGPRSRESVGDAARVDSGDHLHPNDAGYQAMANWIPLREL